MYCVKRRPSGKGEMQRRRRRTLGFQPRPHQRGLMACRLARRRLGRGRIRIRAKNKNRSDQNRPPPQHDQEEEKEAESGWIGHNAASSRAASLLTSPSSTSTTSKHHWLVVPNAYSTSACMHITERYSTVQYSTVHCIKVSSSAYIHRSKASISQTFHLQAVFLSNRQSQRHPSVGPLRASSPLTSHRAHRPASPA